MTLFYSDPWKDNKFGKIKGDKKDSFARIFFEEVRIYKHESSYVLAGQLLSVMGVPRSYKPENPIQPGLVELYLYNEPYEVRQKKPGSGGNGQKAEYETITETPSIIEKHFYQHIQDNPSKYLAEDKALSGSITFMPDIDFQDKSEDTAKEIAIANLALQPREISGNYPIWEAPKPYSKSSYSSYSKGASIDEKINLLKKELASSIAETSFKENLDMPLAAYMHKVISDNFENREFLQAYFALLRAIFS